jgi:hypothetical protein
MQCVLKQEKNTNLLFHWLYALLNAPFFIEMSVALIKIKFTKS